MAKQTKREKQEARAAAERVAEGIRSRDYMILAQAYSEGRVLRIGKRLILENSKT